MFGRTIYPNNFSDLTLFITYKESIVLKNLFTVTPYCGNISCEEPDLIEDFGNKLAADLFHDGKTKRLPRELWPRAVFLMDIMEAVDSLEELKSKGFPPSVRLHPLKGERKGEYAIDINKVKGWRIIFKFKNNMFIDVKVEDYHK